MSKASEITNERGGDHVSGMSVSASLLHKGLGLLMLLCALPYTAVGIAFLSIDYCAHVCILGLILILLALIWSALLLVVGFLLRKADRVSGRSLRVTSWIIASQAVALVGCMGLVIYLMTEG